MIPRQPEPPALPGIITPPKRLHGRLWELARHYRWEALPFYTAIPVGAVVELQAATDPAWTTPAAYGATAAVGAGITAVVRHRKAAAFGIGAASGACAWACGVTATGPGITGIVIGAIATAGASVEYWRLIARRRDHHHDRGIDLEIAKFDAMKAYARTQAIPSQRPAPAIEAVVDRGELPTVEWPGARPGLSISDPIPLSDRTHITLPGGHVLIGGGTDAGKSNLVHVIASTVITRSNARMLGIDMKPGAVELGIYRKAGARIASTKRDAVDLLHWVRDEGIRRGEAMGATIHDEGTLTRSWTATEEDPHLVLVIDELAELVDADPKAAQILKSHTRLLRAMGITIVAATQTPSRAAFGGDTDGRGQYGTRICVATFEPIQTNMILGQGAHNGGWRADLLDGRGTFLIQSRQHRDPEPDRAYYMTDPALANHVNNWAAGAPQQRDAEPDPFARPAEPAFKTTGSVTGDILAYLADRSATPKEVADAIGGKPDAVRARMSQLASPAQGKLVSLGDGRYKASKDGKAIAGNVVAFQRRAKA